MTARNANRSVDGVRLAVMSNRLDGIIRRMTNTMLRTGRSGVINTARDFSCSILTADGRLVAAAEAAPIHVLYGPDQIAGFLKEYEPTLKRGDAFLHNSPYHGNSHAADHCMLIPVIDRDGKHRFTVLVKAHQADCGNALPSTYSPGARDVFEEGALLFNCLKVQEDYRDRADVIRMCQLQIRVPEQWYGDYLALVGATRVGEQRMLELGEEIGWDELDEFVEDWFDYSEDRMAAALAPLPAGSHSAESTHDPFPGAPDGVKIKVKVTIDPEEPSIEVDLRENPDCLPNGLNLTEACARTAAALGVMNSIHEDIPVNAGTFRRLKIRLRENCCVGIPRHPTSCSAATTNLADRVTSATHRALAAFGEGLGMAEFGACIPPSVGVVSGTDPRTGGPFINQLFLGMGGGGAAAVCDGWLTIATPCTGGVILRDSIELDELRLPLRVEAQRLLRDSEGAGKFTGAPSIVSEFEPVDTTITLAYAADGVLHPPLGVRGGHDGLPNRQWKRGPDGELEEMPSYVDVFELEPGERVVAHYASGAGYGDPKDRDPELVREHVEEGWISAERAREVYGVVLDDDGQVDRSATLSARSAS